MCLSCKTKTFSKIAGKCTVEVFDVKDVWGKAFLQRGVETFIGTKSDLPKSDFVSKVISSLYRCFSGVCVCKRGH